jgi:hypothetical protein
VIVDNRSEVRDFLASRPARITPERAGLPAFGANRRVPGLRREEVALFAGFSVDYCTRLERGNLSGVSESVLEALAGALQLDEAEHACLLGLARAANDTVAILRTEAGRNPYDQGLPNLVGELSTRSDESVPDGPRTRCVSTEQGSKTFITRSSVTFI